MENGWLILALAIIAYLLGLLTGWVVWRLAKQSSESKTPGGARIASVLSAVTPDGDKSKFAANGKHDAPDDLKLAALDAEIKEAKAVLEADLSEQEALNERLREIDAAVKRANGRLKLVLKTVQNAKNG